MVEAWARDHTSKQEVRVSQGWVDSFNTLLWSERRTPTRAFLVLSKGSAPETTHQAHLKSLRDLPGSAHQETSSHTWPSGGHNQTASKRSREDRTDSRHGFRTKKLRLAGLPYHVVPSWTSHRNFLIMFCVVRGLAFGIKTPLETPASMAECLGSVPSSAPWAKPPVNADPGKQWQ